MKLGLVGLEPWEKDFVKKFFPKAVCSGEILNTEMVSVFVDTPVTKAILQKNTKIRYITTRSTGYDHIDMLECRKRGIIVSNVPKYGEVTVAEHTFALLLTLSRRMVDAVEQPRNGHFSPKGLTGFDLWGKTIGVVGCGNIGQHVVRIAKGFGMDVLVFDVRQDKKLAKQLGFRYVQLQTLLRRSDVVTLHLPYTKETHHIINKDTLQVMKGGSYLLNTARGGLVDTGALVNSLRQRHLAGAGLDVLEEENHLCEEAALLGSAKQCKVLLGDHLLLQMPNVVVTPHNAFNTDEALQKILETTISNIQTYLKGKPQNVVGKH